jgi:hypothetical protein
MATTDLKAVELRLRAILDRYREHLVESTIYKMPVLSRKGAKSTTGSPASSRSTGQ